MNKASPKPIACNLNAFSPRQRKEHALFIRRVFRAVELVRDLPDGLAFRLPTKMNVALETTKFIMLERLCCPFFNFTLRVESGGATWLHLTGSKGVKQFIKPEFGLANIKKTIRRQA